MLKERVELFPEAARIFEAYFEIDRSDFGRPLFASAVAVLNEYGWTEPEERRLIRRFWRRMWDAEYDIREQKRERKKQGTKDDSENEDE